MTPRAFLSTLRDEADRVIALARSVDHDANVEHLPGWTVGDVLAHLAGDYAWALDIVTRRSTDGAVLGSADERGTELIARFDRAVTLGDRPDAVRAFFAGPLTA